MNENYNAMQQQELNFDNNTSSANDSMLIANQECGILSGHSPSKLLSPPEMMGISKIDHMESSNNNQSSTLSGINRRIANISDYPCT